MANDGGPAFPVIEEETREMYGGERERITYSNSGMSLRDYFAAAALTGYLASTSNANQAKSIADVADKHGVLCTQAVAVMAYEHADAMLAERSK